jgi:sugar lactone lactonase YvrE
MAVLMFLLGGAQADAQLIDTLAGRGAYTTPVTATAANVNPWPIAVASATAVNFPSNVYFADHSGVYRYDPKLKTVTLVAGNDIRGCTGGELGKISGIALDPAGNLYLADFACQIVWKVTVGGTISVFAQTGLRAPYYLHVAGNNLLIADFNQGILSVPLAGGMPTANAANARLKAGGYYPEAVTSDAAGNLYVISTYFSAPGADAPPDILYKVAAGGVVTQLATLEYCSEGLAIDGSGNLYTADYCANNVYQISPTGLVTIVAGTSTGGFSADGTLATQAKLGDPADVAIDSSGTIYVTDDSNWRIRTFKLGGTLSTIIGNQDGIGGSATAVWIPGDNSFGLTTDLAGNLYYGVMKISSSGLSSLYLSRGGPGFSGDGGSAVNALVGVFYGSAHDSLGNLYISDQSNNRIRKIDTGGVISTIAGNGTFTSSTTGNALLAGIQQPGPIAIDSVGNIYVSEAYPCFYCGPGSFILKIDTTGNLSVFAGSPTSLGFSGDGGAATSALLSGISGLAFDRSDNLYVADTYNNRVRMINTSGVISTVAGNGNRAFTGDGVVATSTALNAPTAVVADRLGNIYITDTGNHRIRKVSVGTGIMSTIAGTGTPGFGGDGGIATAAAINTPTAMAIDPTDTIYFDDAYNYRLRRIRGVTDTTPPVVTPTITPAPNANGWNHAAVSLSWTVSDPQSGIQSLTGCGSASVTTDTTSGGSVFTCSATSIGGTTAVPVTIKKDTVAPTMLITSPSNGGSYALNSTLLAGYTCNDAVSGVASCTSSVVNGAAISTAKKGSYSLTVTATDRAGNTASSKVSFSVH